MEYKTLSNVRYVVPGAMLYGLLSWICWTTGWCELAIPGSIAELGKLVLAYVLSFPYIVLGIRDRMNRQYFDQVNKNLVTRLTAPFANNPQVPADLTWNRVKPIFYYFIDNDNSLKHQSMRAFANGALWTSAADLRAVSLIGVALFSLTFLFGNAIPNAEFAYGYALIGMLLCFVIFCLSFLFSKMLTRRQMGIGNDQVDVIVNHHRQELQQRLSQV